MELSIKSLISDKRIETLMQLIVSPNKDFVSGVEALSRGVHPETGELISPALLFAMAREAEQLIALERLMLEKAFETFKPLYETQKELLLFINMSPEFIEKCLEEPIIETLVLASEIPARNIFFDINPFKFNQLEMIKKFVDCFRAKGFYFCVDDIGVDYSNLDKILYLSPDVVKLNIRALKQLKQQKYAEKLIQALKLLTEPLGIVMVGKGIENETDLMFSLETGAQFMQGFFISRPVDLNYESLVSIKKRYATLVEAHVKEESSNIQLSRMITAKAYILIRSIADKLTTTLEPITDAIAHELFCKYPMIESLWFLDGTGKQMGKTWVNSEAYEIKHTSMFQLHNDGSDFAAKDLYVQLYDTILDVWVTPPFKSTMTNNLCISCSKRLQWHLNEAVLCLDVNVEACTEGTIEREPIEDDNCKIVIQPMTDSKEIQE